MKISKEYIRTRTDKKIVLAEGKSRIIFDNPTGSRVKEIKVDGAILFPLDVSQKKCDYLVIDGNETEHFVELKGSRISVAIEQLENSIRILSADIKRFKYSFIIPTRVNTKLNSTIQRYSIKFQNSFFCRLIVKENCEHKLPSSV